MWRILDKFLWHICWTKICLDGFGEPFRDTMARKVHPLDVIRVGEPSNLPLSSNDTTILEWAEREFMVRPNSNVPDVIEFLLLAAYASEPIEWLDRISYIP